MTITSSAAQMARTTRQWAAGTPPSLYHQPARSQDPVPAGMLPHTSDNLRHYRPLWHRRGLTWYTGYELYQFHCEHLQAANIVKMVGTVGDSGSQLRDSSSLCIF